MPFRGLANQDKNSNVAILKPQNQPALQQLFSYLAPEDAKTLGCVSKACADAYRNPVTAAQWLLNNAATALGRAPTLWDLCRCKAAQTWTDDQVGAMVEAIRIGCSARCRGGGGSHAGTCKQALHSDPPDQTWCMCPKCRPKGGAAPCSSSCCCLPLTQPCASLAHFAAVQRLLPPPQAGCGCERGSQEPWARPRQARQPRRLWRRRLCCRGSRSRSCSSGVRQSGQRGRHHGRSHSRRHCGRSGRGPAPRGGVAHPEGGHPHARAAAQTAARVRAAHPGVRDAARGRHQQQGGWCQGRWLVGQRRRVS